MSDIMCAYCHLDTAGNHQPDCPLARQSSGLPNTGTYFEPTPVDGQDDPNCECKYCGLRGEKECPRSQPAPVATSANKLDSIPFPECSKNCGAVEMLGVGECESVCPKKFDKDGSPVQPAPLTGDFIPVKTAALMGYTRDDLMKDLERINKQPAPVKLNQSDELDLLSYPLLRLIAEKLGISLHSCATQKKVIMEITLKLMEDKNG